MKQYTGTKTLLATVMTLGAYNALREWDLPKEESPDTEGCLVEYQDGGKSNHPDYNGYISWSPKDVFEKSYYPSETPLDRMLIEQMQDSRRLEDLRALLAKPQPAFISDKQWSLLRRQEVSMSEKADILYERIEDMK